MFLAQFKERQCQIKSRKARSNYMMLTYMMPTKKPLKCKNTNRLKAKGQEKIYHANSNQKKAGVIILESDEVEFLSKNKTRDKKDS